MGYDRGDSFPFDFEPNGIPFGSKWKGKLSPRSYPIHCERKGKYSFLSVSHERWKVPRGKRRNIEGVVTHSSAIFNTFSQLLATLVKKLAKADALRTQYFLMPIISILTSPAIEKR